MARRVLVTGAGGFIGRHCLDALLADGGWDVRALSRRAPAIETPGVQWVTGDLLTAGDPERIIDEVRPTHLLHLAWITTPGEYLHGAANIEWVSASLRLLTAFAAGGGARVVSAGTCFEYAFGPGALAESDALAPATLYAQCKRSLAEAQDALCADRRIPNAWARIFYVYGPGEHPRRLVPAVARALLADEPAECSHGRQVRDYMYVEDLAAALAALLRSDLTGPVNVATGRETTVGQIVEEIARQVGRPDLLRPGAIPVREDEPPEIRADVTRLGKELGFTPRFDLERGISFSLDALRHAGAREAV